MTLEVFLVMKAKKNYKAWEVNSSDFPIDGTEDEKIRFLLNYAILAPSSHNAQPWKFHVDGNTVFFHAVPERALTVSDPTGRLQHISFGTAIENFVIAADYFGFNPEVELFTKGQHGDAVASVKLGDHISQSLDENHLLHQIPQRHSNRHNYKAEPVPNAFTDMLDGIGSEQVGVHMIDDQERRDAYADLIMAARLGAFDHAPFREEMADYKRNNFTAQHTGIPGFTMGFPALKSLVAPFMIRKTNVVKLSQEKDEKNLKEGTPAYIAITAREQTPEHWIESGRAFQRLLLTATRHGLNTSINVSPAMPGELYERFKEILGTDDFPQISCRIGFAEKTMNKSPRFTLEDLLIE